MSILVAVTGASGSIYGRRILEALVEAGRECWLTASPDGTAVARHELGEQPADWAGRLGMCYYAQGDTSAPFISGSSSPEACVIAPCSMATLGRVASGVASTTIARAADVCLKERRPLVLLVREAPLSLIHIENMRRVTRAGAIVLPASPGFYHRPQTLDDLVDFVAGKVLDVLGVPHSMFERWETLGAGFEPDEA